MKKVCALLFMGIFALPLSAFALTVKSVDFMNVGGKSRIQLTLDGPATYDVTRKGDNVELKISAAKIAPSYARPLVTADFETAVRQITPKQSGQNVVVNITMKVMAPYFVSQDKNQLIMDFDIPASVKQTKAAAPRVTFKESVKTKNKPSQPIDMTSTVVNGLDGTKYTGDPITLEFQNADIHALLRIIAEVSGLNIVTSDDVKGEVTIKLKNVPWDQALDVILESKDLDKMQVGNVVRIAPAATIKATKERKLASIKTEEQLEPLLTSVIPVNFAKSSEIATTIKGKDVGMVSERGSITAEDRTNVLIVKDIKKNVDAIYAMIKRLDRATPQVLIQARIVQADDDFTRGLGIQWGGSYRNQSDRSHFGLSGVKTGSATNLFNTTSTGSAQPGWSTTVSPTPSMAVNLGQNMGSGFGLTLGRLGGSIFDLDLRIDVGENTGQAKVIARPKIVTLDNKKATIRQGEKYPYLTRDKDGNISTELKDIELVLDVTPRIAFDGSINMEINVKRNALGSTKNQLGDPSIASREVQTEVLVKDGETSVIGGIIEEEVHDTTSKIPWLGDLPVIGYLFKGTTVTKNKKELLVFITPHVIAASGNLPQ